MAFLFFRGRCRPLLLRSAGVENVLLQTRNCSTTIVATDSGYFAQERKTIRKAEKLYHDCVFAALSWTLLYSSPSQAERLYPFFPLSFLFLSIKIQRNMHAFSYLAFHISLWYWQLWHNKYHSEKTEFFWKVWYYAKILIIAVPVFLSCWWRENTSETPEPPFSEAPCLRSAQSLPLLGWFSWE